MAVQRAIADRIAPAFLGFIKGLVGNPQYIERFIKISRFTGNPGRPDADRDRNRIAVHIADPALITHRIAQLVTKIHRLFEANAWQDTNEFLSPKRPTMS